VRPTIFRLKTLDGYELAKIRDKQMELAQGGDTVKVSLYGPAYEACRVGIDSWENFLDENDNQIQFDVKSSLARLTPDQALELMGEIMSGGTLSEAEAKNSVGQSLLGNSIPTVTAAAAPESSNGGATAGL